MEEKQISGHGQQEGTAGRGGQEELPEDMKKLLGTIDMFTILIMMIVSQVYKPKLKVHILNTCSLLCISIKPFEEKKKNGMCRGRVWWKGN